MIYLLCSITSADCGLMMPFSQMLLSVHLARFVLNFICHINYRIYVIVFLLVILKPKRNFCASLENQGKLFKTPVSVH